MVFTQTQKQNFNNFEKDVREVIYNAWITSKREATILYNTIENTTNKVIDHFSNFIDKVGIKHNHTENTENTENNCHHSIHIQCIRHMMVINELKKNQLDREWETINTV